MHALLLLGKTCSCLLVTEAPLHSALRLCGVNYTYLYSPGSGRRRAVHIGAQFAPCRPVKQSSKSPASDRPASPKQNTHAPTLSRVRTSQQVCCAQRCGPLVNSCARQATSTQQACTNYVAPSKRNIDDSSGNLQRLGLLIAWQPSRLQQASSCAMLSNTRNSCSHSIFFFECKYSILPICLPTKKAAKPKRDFQVLHTSCRMFCIRPWRVRRGIPSFESGPSHTILSLVL